MTISESYYSQLATQAASLSILPLWYPFFAKSLYQRSQIIESKSPGDLSHSFFFNNKRNYYRGITANLCMQPLFPMTDWLLGFFLKTIKQVNQRDPNIAERIGAGFITGATTVVLANPYEVTVIASQNYRESAYKAFKRVLKGPGVPGLYKGWRPMAFRNGTFISSLLVATPALQEKIKHYIPGSGKAYEIATMILASTIPACGYICVAVPLDFMAIMRQSDPSGKIYTSSFQALGAAYQKHGVAALRAGLKKRLTACIIEITGFNWLKKFYLDRLTASA